MLSAASLSALLLIAAAIPAAGAPSLRVEYTPTLGAALVRDGKAVNNPGDRPAVVILYSDATSRWKATSWTALAPDSGRVTRNAGVLSLDIPSFGGVPITMRLTATVDEAAREVKWQAHITNNAPGVVVGMVGPGLRGITPADGSVLYLPDRPGQRIPDPWKTLATAAHTINYPVPASMQYVTITSPGGGVALHARDQAMGFKQFTIGGKDRELTSTLYPFLEAGGKWISPEITWQALDGDWHAAADHYGAWFRTWAPRPQVSEEIRAMPIVASAVIKARPLDDPYLKDVTKKMELGTYAAALPRMKELRKVGYEGCQLVGWFGGGHDTTYPLHFPSADMGGEAGLKKLLADMKAIGMMPSLYLNARLAEMDGAVLRSNPGWETKALPGQQWFEQYGDRKFRLMCPAVKEWQQHMIGEVTRCAQDYGANGVQLDQVGAAASILCFDERHGHTTPATAWGEGYPAMLAAIRDQARAVSPKFWTWVEGAWEGAGCYTDMCQGGFWPSMPGAETFPQLYRYTLPDHPMFGDARMGGIPYWCNTDLAREAAIRKGSIGIMTTGRFMDNLGLTSAPGVEVHWFKQGKSALLTVYNGGAPGVIKLMLDDAEFGGKAPRKARALAASADVAPTREGGKLVVSVEVPAGQVEAVLVEW